MRRAMTLISVSVLSLSACGGDESTADKTSTTAETTSTEDQSKQSDGNQNEKSGGVESGRPVASSGFTVGFEQGTAGWVEFNDAKIAQDTSLAESGKASLRVEASGSSAFQGVETVGTPVEPDRTYVAIADVRAPKGAKMQVALRESDSSGNELDATVTAFEGTGDWDRVAVERPFESDGEDARIQVRTGDEAQEITFYVDGPSLQVRDAE